MIKYKSTYIKNIYYMLAYAFSSLTPTASESISSEEFDHIHNLFAWVLSSGISRQLKQGLYREYQEKKETIPTVKGKIVINDTIHNVVERKCLVTCEYDDLTENNIFNQILKTTVNILIRHGDVETKYKDALKRELFFFSDVDVVEPKGIQWSTIRFNRSNQSYILLLGICQLVLDGMILSTEEGDIRLNNFVDSKSMEKLYEKFVLEYYKQEHGYLNASPSYVKWNIDEEYSSELLPAMQTDITLTNKMTGDVLIIDTKFNGEILQTQYDAATIRSAHMYQIYAYVKNKQETTIDDSKVAGMLLYAGTEENLQPDNRYVIGGNLISVQTLDLNQEFSEIRKKLDNIVCEYLPDDRFQSVG